MGLLLRDKIPRKGLSVVLQNKKNWVAGFFRTGSLRTECKRHFFSISNCLSFCPRAYIVWVIYWFAHFPTLVSTSHCFSISNCYFFASLLFSSRGLRVDTIIFIYGIPLNTFCKPGGFFWALLFSTTGASYVARRTF